MKIRRDAALLATCLCLAAAAPTRADAPLRLPNGEPVVCVYYFTHWWEPWKSDDEAIRQDLRRLRGMGFNTLLLDHEWSQAIDGNWRLLDRANRLAAECSMSIAITRWSTPTWPSRPRCPPNSRPAGPPNGPSGRLGSWVPWSSAT